MSKSRPYTKNEDDFIRGNYLSMLFRDIGKHLGRSAGAINHRVIKLELSKKTLRRWNDAEDEIIRTQLGLGLERISAVLDRHPSEVSNRASRLGIPFQKRTKRGAKDGYGFSRRTDINGRRVYSWDHIEVVEKRIGRKLVKPELVHHVNGIKSDNRDENLYLCRNKSHHKLVHTSLDKMLAVLLERRVVRFDCDKGVYELCDQNK